MLKKSKIILKKKVLQVKMRLWKSNSILEARNHGWTFKEKFLNQREEVLRFPDG